MNPSRIVIRLCIVLLLTAAPMSVFARVVVVVSKDSTVSVLDRAELTHIFLGSPYRLANGSYARPIDLVEGAPERDQFYRTILDKSAAQIKAHWSLMIFTGRGRPPKQLHNADQVKDYLAAHPEAIGYMDERSVDERLRIIQIH